MPTILRTWRGKIRTTDRQDYVAYPAGINIAN